MPKRKLKMTKAVAPDWRTKPRTLRAFEGEWLALANAAGGVQALSVLLGVSYPTLYRWAVKGDPMSKADRFLVQSIAVKFGVLAPSMPSRPGEN